MRTPTIAMLAANPAFAAILSRTLEEDGGYTVASFTSVEQLTGFLRTSPADVVVLDTDTPGYRPSQEDIMEFQKQLSELVRKNGY